MSNKTGKQYVVVIAGGRDAPGTGMGDETPAVFLPGGAAAPAAKPARAQ